jgi:hypothetical protein
VLSVYNASVTRLPRAIFSNIVLGASPLGLSWKILLASSRVTLIQYRPAQLQTRENGHPGHGSGLRGDWLLCTWAARKWIPVGLVWILASALWQRKYLSLLVMCHVLTCVWCAGDTFPFKVSAAGPGPDRRPRRHTLQMSSVQCSAARA